MSKSNSYEAGMDNDFVSAFTTAIVGNHSGLIQSTAVPLNSNKSEIMKLLRRLESS